MLAVRLRQPVLQQLTRASFTSSAKVSATSSSSSTSSELNADTKSTATATTPETQSQGITQAPNRATIWSTSQRPRPLPKSAPIFEQTNFAFQPAPLSAMELVSQDPIRVVHGRKAVCDGGGGALGHPKIFINLDKPGPKPCGYCGVRFEQAPHAGHDH